MRNMRTGYNSGTFDDLAALSVSSSLSAIPADIAGQALGVSTAAVSSNIAPNSFTFMPLGPAPDATLEEYRASLAGGVPAQPVALTHRIQLSDVADHVRSKQLMGWINYNPGK
jgi:oxalate decarboxylase